MHDDAATILDMVLACKRIARFVDQVDEVSFLSNEQKQWAVVSQLSIIGEAVRRLSGEFRDEHPEIAWRQIAGTRDRLVHAYDKIDWSLVWRTAVDDVPDLRSKLEPLVPPRDDEPNG